MGLQVKFFGVLRKRVPGMGIDAQKVLGGCGSFHYYKKCAWHTNALNFFPCVRRSRGPMSPPHRGGGAQDPQRDGDPIAKKPKFSAITKSVPGMGPKETKFDDNLGPRLHSLTAAGRGSISPGEGDGTGSNSLPRTIRIAVWEIFSGSSRSGKFFHRFPLRVCAIWEIFSRGLRATGK